MSGRMLTPEQLDEIRERSRWAIADAKTDVPALLDHIDALTDALTAVAAACEWALREVLYLEGDGWRELERRLEAAVNKAREVLGHAGA